MNRYLNILNAHIPEFELYNRSNNFHIRNKTIEEAKAILEKYAAPLPDELKQTKYLEQTYSDRDVYLINNRYYLLKQSKSGVAYLFEL